MERTPLSQVLKMGLILALTHLTSSQTTSDKNQWSWISGTNTGEVGGVYGTQGTPSTMNYPGGRRAHQMVFVASINCSFMFGGYGRTQSGAVGYLNDLWTYNVTSTEWSWLTGSKIANTRGIYGTLGSSSTGYNPGSRSDFPMVYHPRLHVIYLYGGYGYDSAGTLGIE
jgi:hypothetical protein